MTLGARAFGHAVGLAALLAVAAPAPLLAEAGLREPLKVSLRLSKAASAQAGGFDWLAKRRPDAQVVRVSLAAAPRQVGSGSWICSPAGFGKRSRCYAN
jgi:hypothetical protein